MTMELDGCGRNGGERRTVDGFGRHEDFYHQWVVGCYCLDKVSRAMVRTTISVFWEREV